MMHAPEVIGPWVGSFHPWGDGKHRMVKLGHSLCKQQWKMVTKYCLKWEVFKLFCRSNETSSQFGLKKKLIELLKIHTVYMQTDCRFVITLGFETELTFITSNLNSHHWKRRYV